MAVHTRDPISRAGVVSQLRTRPEVSLEDWEEGAKEAPEILILVADTVDDEVLRLLRHIRRSTTARTVLVVAEIDEQKLANAAECGIAGIVRRSDATPEHLVDAIGTVARGAGHLPPDLVGTLLGEVARLQSKVLSPRGLHFSGLSDREVNVLRLVAEGHDTPEIADRLAFSERTIKNVLHSVMTRLQLRNRSHAVAYALRQGLI
ncbi:helix-turn-helix transcriptional regulator [Streptomyces sp. CB02460]|uniref:helix-turn-helix transcriptional regulator n=1 Tax=Streptomyces sp. CB02460 TaxID=1703941 RepID=UPI001F5B2E16|nr:response regulator transcription factor [Streptomyces sp. CB02460]